MKREAKGVFEQSKVRYMGRFDFSDPEGPVFAWSSSTIKAGFKGTGISARIRPMNSSQTGNWLNVIIDDGAPVPVLIDSDRTYELASGLEEGNHEICLFKRTEALVGELQFMGFFLPEGGELNNPPEPAERRMEFIGDSITCGYGNEAPNIESGFKTGEENGYLAYGSITARAVGAEHMTLAWSGQGVYQNYDEAKDSTMSDKYLLTLPERPQSLWDFSRWIPHAVVINLGTNDFAHGTPEIEAFSAAYGKLVQSVRANYPKAHIFCVVGPMTHAPGSYIDRLVQEFNAKGDRHVHFVELPMQNIEVNGIGGDWHPSLKTHEESANVLIKEVRSKLSW